MVISAASGAVGSVAGQFAKRAGARVVGIAGGPEKCLWVQDSLGFDDCVDHRSLDLRAELLAMPARTASTPISRMSAARCRRRCSSCSIRSRAWRCAAWCRNTTKPDLPPGPNLGFVVGKRVQIQGFIVSDKPEKIAEWRELAAPWVADGSLLYREDELKGWRTHPTRWPACWAGAISASCWYGWGTT